MKKKAQPRTASSLKVGERFKWNHRAFIVLHIESRGHIVTGWFRSLDIGTDERRDFVATDTIEIF